MEEDAKDFGIGNRGPSSGQGINSALAKRTTSGETIAKGKLLKNFMVSWFELFDVDV